MRFRQLLLCLALIAAAAPVAVLAEEMNGFDLKGSLLPSGQIHFGGPPKDGIPAIDHPQFIPGKLAAFLRHDDAVLGISRSGTARAYPVRILNWHVMFPVALRAAGFHPKERVLGIKIGELAKAYPFVEPGRTTAVISDRIGDTELSIRFDRTASSATACTADGKQFAVVVGYWFAWYAFNPKTAVFRAAGHPSPKRRP